MQRDTPKYAKELARQMRQEPTETEEILWKYLRGRKMRGKKFRRQHSLGRYIADFYCSESRLVVEIDGEVHNTKERKEYDEIRQIELESRFIKVIRFRNEDVINEIDRVLDEIGKAIDTL